MYGVKTASAAAYASSDVVHKDFSLICIHPFTRQ